MGDRNFGVLSMAWHATEGNHPCLFRLTEVRARKETEQRGSRSSGETDKGISLESEPRGSRAVILRFPPQPRLPDACWAFRRPAMPARKLQKLYFFTTSTLPPEQILRAYGYRWEHRDRSALSQVRGALCICSTCQNTGYGGKEIVLSVAAYIPTRAAMNVAGSALGLDPRQFSFSRHRTISTPTCRCSPTQLVPPAAPTTDAGDAPSFSQWSSRATASDLLILVKSGLSSSQRKWRINVPLQREEEVASGIRHDCLPHKTRRNLSRFDRRKPYRR